MRFLIGDVLVEAPIEEACGVFGQEIRGGILKSLGLLTSASIPSISYILRYKRLVSFTNLIVALTTLISSFQRLIRLLIFLPSSYLLKQPNVYNRSPDRSPYYSPSLILYYAHLLQEKRKCYIDSISPQSHNAVFNVLILQRMV